MGEGEDDDGDDEDEGEEGEEADADEKEEGEEEAAEEDGGEDEESGSESEDSQEDETPLPAPELAHHGDPESELNAPHHSESLKDYYSRTRLFWSRIALTSSAATLTISGEKGIRAGAFELAKAEHERMQPILEKTRELLQIDEEEANAVNKGRGRTEKGTGTARSSARK
jgi:hypothetical protein